MMQTGLFLLQVIWNGTSDVYFSFVNILFFKEESVLLCKVFVMLQVIFSITDSWLSGFGHRPSSGMCNCFCSLQRTSCSPVHCIVVPCSREPHSQLWSWRQWGSCLALQFSSKIQVARHLPSTCLARSLRWCDCGTACFKNCSSCFWSGC